MEIPTLQVTVLAIPEVQIVERVQEQFVEIIKVGPHERVQQLVFEHIGGRARASDPGTDCGSCHGDSPGSLFLVCAF